MSSPPKPSNSTNIIQRHVSTRHDGDTHISEATYEHMGYFLSGAVASVTSRTATAPLDRLKIYLISNTANSATAWNFARQGQLLKATSASLSGFSQACHDLWNIGGIRSLWAGNGLNIVKMVPEGAIKFGVYEASRRFFARLEGVDSPASISVFAQTASGGLGGVAAQFAAYPIDTLRFRMQCEMQKGGTNGIALMKQTAKKMWATGGIRAYFRGLLWGLVGQYPYSAIDLTVFEYTKRWWIRRREAQGLDPHLTAPASATIGGFSGALGASLVWPLNMLRTRLQTGGTLLHKREYNGIMDVTRETFRNEGIRGFFKGIVPNLVKVVPSVAITYTVYEQMKQAMGLRESEP